MRAQRDFLTLSDFERFPTSQPSNPIQSIHTSMFIYAPPLALRLLTNFFADCILGLLNY